MINFLVTPPFHFSRDLIKLHSADRDYLHSAKNLTSCQPTCDRIMLSNWSHNLRENDQKVIQPSYGGNIILTWYMIYRGRISQPLREPISIRAGFRTFVKRSSLIGRAVVAPSFVSSRPRAPARYQKSLVARWRTYPADEKLSIRPEANQTTR